MLAVGRALVLNPRVLLLDEPLEELAPIIVEELLKAFAAHHPRRGMSAILVEQNAKSPGRHRPCDHCRGAAPWFTRPTARPLERPRGARNASRRHRYQPTAVSAVRAIRAMISSENRLLFRILL